MGSRAASRASRHAGGTRSRSSEAVDRARGRRAPPATMAHPRHDLDRDVDRPRQHGVPRRQPGGRRDTDGCSVPRNRRAAATGSDDPDPRTRERGCGSNAAVPASERVCNGHTALRVAAGRGRNRLPRRAFQGLGARFPRQDEEAAHCDSEPLALQRPHAQVPTGRVPLVRLASLGWASRCDGNSSGKTGGTGLEARCVALSRRSNTLRIRSCSSNRQEFVAYCWRFRLRLQR